MDENWFSVGRDGFIAPGAEMVGGHAVALASYDDEREHRGLTGWFGFINSWSESWGNRGIGYLSYASFVRALLSSHEIVLSREPTGPEIA